MLEESHLGHLKFWVWSDFAADAVELVVVVDDEVVDEGVGDGDGEEARVPSKMVPLIEILLPAVPPKWKPEEPPRSSWIIFWKIPSLCIDLQQSKKKKKRKAKKQVSLSFLLSFSGLKKIK